MATTTLKPIVFTLKNKSVMNNFFRKVEFTSKYMQITFMTLKPDEDIGKETHKKTDQIFLVISGHGVVKLKNTKKIIEEGDLVVIPSNNVHNIKNTGKNNLKLLTVYCPPHHLSTVIHRTKEDAEEDKSDVSFGHTH